MMPGLTRLACIILYFLIALILPCSASPILLGPVWARSVEGISTPPASVRNAVLGILLSLACFAFIVGTFAWVGNGAPRITLRGALSYLKREFTDLFTSVFRWFGLARDLRDRFRVRSVIERLTSPTTHRSAAPPAYLQGVAGGGRAGHSRAPTASARPNAAHRVYAESARASEVKGMPQVGLPVIPPEVHIDLQRARSNSRDSGSASSSTQTLAV